MTTSMEETGASPANAADEQSKATKKAHGGARSRHVAPTKAKVGKKGSPAKKPAKGAKKASAAREGSKTGKIVDMLKRPEGATMKQLMKATGWQPHSVRGFLAGTVRKKLGLKLSSSEGENGERTYSVQA